MKNLSVYTLVFVSVVALAGCAKAPVQSVDQAMTSIQLASEAEANYYVPELYQAAVDSFAAAEAEIAVQDARNAIMRNYDRAEALLTFATQTADSAVASAAEAKNQMAADNEILFQQADAAIAQVQEMMGRAPRGKDGVFALASIGTDLTATTSTVLEARAAQAEGRIYEARELAQSALDRANALVAELDSAIQSVQPGRRS